MYACQLFLLHTCGFGAAELFCLVDVFSVTNAWSAAAGVPSATKDCRTVILGCRSLRVRVQKECGRQAGDWHWNHWQVRSQSLLPLGPFSSGVYH